MRPSWRSSIGALTVAGLSAAASAKEQVPLSGPLESKNPLTEEFAQFAKETMAKWQVPGLSIAVIDGDNVYAEGYGMATLPDTPATPETIWYGASTTKAFTAATLAHLMDSGNYSALDDGWQTTFASVVRDDFVLEDEWMTNHITLEDAASHRTGMTRHDLSSPRIIDGKQATVKDVVRNLRHLHIALKPRYTYSYCNLMYEALSHVVETVTGKWLGDVFKENIWEPLGMKSTYLSAEDAHKGPHHVATGYYWGEKEEDFVEAPTMPLVEVSGAGAIMSNVLDYSKWIQCLLSEGAPFSERTHQDIKTPRILDGMASWPKDNSMYTLGWSRGAYRGIPFYSHDGGLPAFGAVVYWFPSIKFGVVTFANTGMTSNLVGDVLSWRLVDEKLGVPAKDRYDATTMWRKLIDEVVGHADEATAKLYPDIPDPPLPPTMKQSDLVGTYYDAGYKNITLREEENPLDPSETILVARRTDMTWQETIKMRQVSGDYWIMLQLKMGIEADLNANWLRSEFRAGADGKPTGFEMFLRGASGGVDQGSVWFNKIA